MRFCIAVGCGKTHQKNNVRICSFPADQQRCDEWIEACGRTDFRGFCAQKLHHSTSFGLCELHFTDEQWCNPLYKPSGLRPDAVPTVFHCDPRPDGSLLIPTRRPYRRKTGNSPPPTVRIKQIYRKRKLTLESGEQGELCEWSGHDEQEQREKNEQSECNEERFNGVVLHEEIVAADKSPQNTKRKYCRKKIHENEEHDSTVQPTDNNVCEVDLLEMSDCANTLTALNNSLTPTTIQTTGQAPTTQVLPVRVHVPSGTTGAVCTVHSGTVQCVAGNVSSVDCVTHCCHVSASNPFLLQLQYKLSKVKEQKQYLTYQLRVERSKTKRLEKKVATLVEQLKRCQSVTR